MFNGNSGNGGDSNNGEIIGSLLNVISIMIGLQNLEENRQQSEDNNVEKHNQRQAKQILDDLHKQFDKQNELLYYQNNLLEQILGILNNSTQK